MREVQLYKKRKKVWQRSPEVTVCVGGVNERRLCRCAGGGRGECGFLEDAVWSVFVVRALVFFLFGALCGIAMCVAPRSGYISGSCLCMEASALSVHREFVRAFHGEIGGRGGDGWGGRRRFLMRAGLSSAIEKSGAEHPTGDRYQRDTNQTRGGLSKCTKLVGGGGGEWEPNIIYNQSHPCFVT